MKWMLTLPLVASLAACAAAATPTPTPIPTTHDVRGTLILASSEGVKQLGTGASSACEGQGGYHDVTATMQVTARNEAGALIGTANLGAGVKGPVTPAHPADTVCIFRFAFMGLPEAHFYAFESGNRGAVSYAKADMEAGFWTFTLTLGE